MAQSQIFIAIAGFRSQVCGEQRGTETGLPASTVVLPCQYHSTIAVYKVSRGECARLRENVPYVKVHRYNPKHLRISEVERLRRKWREKFESMTAVTHLLITKYILKLPGIYSFCNVNIRT